jgi:hypothetical protein
VWPSTPEPSKMMSKERATCGVVVLVRGEGGELCEGEAA